MAMAAFNYFKKLRPKVDEAYEAISWGTGIGSEVNPKVIEPMKAIGIDLTDTSVYFPKDINHPSIKDKLPDVERIYTMGCMDKDCELPGELKITGDWELDDPAKEETDVDAVRDKIAGKSLGLIVELNDNL